MGSYIRFDCAMKRLLRNTVCGVGGIADDIAEYEGSHMPRCADLWGVTERDKFGGYRQNGEKNLVDTDKMAKKNLVELSVKRIFAHKSEDKWKIM